MKTVIFRLALWLTIAIVAMTAAACQAENARQKEEEEMGRRYAAELEEQLSLIEEGPELERVRRIGEALAEIANKHEVAAEYGSSEICKFDYKFNVVEDEDVNAFSLPGGHIYVNTGLLKFAETDDELAAVLAHEIAHSAHRHVSYLIRKQTKVDRYLALIALAGIMGDIRSTDLNNLMFGVQMLKTAKLSGYTQEAEKDADRTAVAYLVRSTFDPNGMLSFMKKLEKQHAENPTAPLGIFQTHPAPHKRVDAIAKAMKAEGLDIDTREARDIAYARCVPISEDSDDYQVVISGRVLYTPAGMGSGPSSRERAEAIANDVNNLLDSRVQPSDILCDYTRGCISVNDRQIIRIVPEDVQANQMNGRALLSKARSVLSFALWADWVSSTCDFFDESCSTH